MKLRTVFWGCALGLACIVIQKSAISRISPDVSIGKTLKGFSSVMTSKAFARTTTDDLLTDRLGLIKALYLFVNGGEDGTWPDTANGKLTGADAPSEDLEQGFLGIVNGIMGPKGDVSKFLVEEGYETCDSLPEDETDFKVTDELLGKLTVTVSKSTLKIPSGLQNSGKFERRIEIATKDSTVAVIHLHCSTKVMTMLMRLDIELDNEGEEENIEAVLEGSEEGPDLHLQFIAQNPAAEAEDMAIEFKTTDGDVYSIYVAHTSNKADASGNGPAHTLAAITGSLSDKKANLALMGGNTNISDNSTSNDMAGLVFSKTSSFEDFDDDNKFCIDTEDGSEATKCVDPVYPGKLAISGLTAWTIKAVYALGQETSNVADISDY